MAWLSQTRLMRPAGNSRLRRSCSNATAHRSVLWPHGEQFSLRSSKPQVEMIWFILDNILSCSRVPCASSLGWYLWTTTRAAHHGLGCAFALCTTPNTCARSLDFCFGERTLRSHAGICRLLPCRDNRVHGAGTIIMTRCCLDSRVDSGQKI